jgi:long-chain acyl-CoA synthetase
MEPIPQMKEGQHFDTAKGPFVMVIFEDTCSLWSIALQGAMSQSMTVATCYATLGKDAVIAAVNETGATTLLLNWKKASEFADLSNQMPTLKTIIASTYEMPEGTPTPLAKRGSKVQIISSEDVLQLGSTNLEKYPVVPPKPHDTCVIMYTSGSTGKPKGVIMTHSQIVSGVQGMKMNVHLRPGKEVVISYLPLAHVLALQIENAVLNSGGKACYSDPRQLPIAMSMFKPTLQAGVPKVYEIIQGSLLKQLSKGPPIAKTIFDTCFAWKSFLLSIGMDAPVTNALFFKLISSKIFGGVLQFAVSGGGSLNERLHNFCRVVFCCPLIQGYALTETCVGGCFQALDDVRCGVVGPPVPCVEIMLQSEPDFKDSAGLPYLYTDTVGSNGETVIGRGEICMRGPSISTGYYKLPDKTKEDYDAEGFFHTGDIGQFTADGVIQIIDRKKNIVKLKGGEYVAVENMENAFSQSPFVQMVCVLANGDLDRPLAIVNADRFHLKKWASDKNSSYNSLEDLASKKETREAVIASMKVSGKEAKLTALENGIKDCCLITNMEWGPGNGMTASRKLDRAKILSMHAAEINAMYERNGVTTKK